MATSGVPMTARTSARYFTLKMICCSGPSTAAFRTPTLSPKSSVVARQGSNAHCQAKGVGSGKGQFFVADLHQHAGEDRARLVLGSCKGDFLDHFLEQSRVEDHRRLSAFGAGNQGKFRGIHALDI